MTICHQHIEGIGQQQIGARHRGAELGLNLVDHLIGGARHVLLDIGLGVVSGKRHGLSVIDQLDIGVAAGAANPDLVRPAQLHLTGTRELDLLQIRGDDLDIAVERRRDGFLAADIVGHRLEDLGGIVIARAVAPTDSAKPAIRAAFAANPTMLPRADFAVALCVVVSSTVHHILSYSVCVFDIDLNQNGASIKGS